MILFLIILISSYIKFLVINGNFTNQSLQV